MANCSSLYYLPQEQIRLNDQFFEYHHRQPMSITPSPMYPPGLQHRDVQSQEGYTFPEHRAQMPSSHHGLLSPQVSGIGDYAGLNNHQHVQSQEVNPTSGPRAHVPSRLDGSFFRRMTGIGDYGLNSSQNNMPDESSWRHPAYIRTDPDPARRQVYRSERLSGVLARKASDANRSEKRNQLGFYSGYRKRYDKNLRRSRARDIPTAKVNQSRYEWFPARTDQSDDHASSASTARHVSAEASGDRPKVDRDKNEGARATKSAALTAADAPTSRAPPRSPPKDLKKARLPSPSNDPTKNTPRSPPKDLKKARLPSPSNDPTKNTPRSPPKDLKNARLPIPSNDPTKNTPRSPPKDLKKAGLPIPSNDPTKNRPRSPPKDLKKARLPIPSNDPTKNRPRSPPKDLKKAQLPTPSNDPAKNRPRSPPKDLKKARLPIPSNDPTKNRPGSLLKDPTVAASVSQRHATPLSRKRHLPNAFAPVSEKKCKPSGQHTSAVMVGDQPDGRSSRKSTEQGLSVAAAKRSCQSVSQPVGITVHPPLAEERDADQNAASGSTGTDRQPDSQSETQVRTIETQTSSDLPTVIIPMRIPHTVEGVRGWQDAIKNSREQLRKAEALLETIRKNFVQ